MPPLFAQVRNNDPDGIPPEMMGVFLVVMLVVLAIALVIFILYLLTLQKALSRCSPRNRTMEPGQVWLNLVPFLNIVWQFITVTRIAESLSNEFRARGRGRGGDDYGKGVGITYCVMNLLGWIPFIGVVLSLIGLVCYIVHWVKIAGYSSQLASRASYDDEYDDDEDDRPRRGRDRDDEDDDRPRRGQRDRGDRDDDDDRPEKPWSRGNR